MVRPPMTRSWQRPLTAGLLLTVVCVAFEGLAVTTVMPTAVRELGGLMSYGWAFSAFMLTNVVGIAVAGERIDRHGPRGPLAAGLALFALGLLGGGAAPSMAALIAARAVQGFGAGELSAVIYACVARCYPADQQPRMLALLSTAWVVPGLVGPGVSGYVADHMSWRLVFFGLVPIVFVATALTVPCRGCPRHQTADLRSGCRARSGPPSSSPREASSCSSASRPGPSRRCWASQHSVS